MHETLGKLVVWRRFSGVASFFQGAIDDFLQEQVGLSLSELELMIHVRSAKEGRKMVDLSAKLRITKAGVTKMVDRLETQGFVRRELLPQDRRVRFIVLTPMGASALKNTRPRLQAWLETRFLDPLSDNDLRAVNRAMLKIVDANGLADPADRP